MKYTISNSRIWLLLLFIVVAACIIQAIFMQLKMSTSTIRKGNVEAVVARIRHGDVSIGDSTVGIISACGMPDVAFAYNDATMRFAVQCYSDDDSTIILYIRDSKIFAAQLVRLTGGQPPEWLLVEESIFADYLKVLSQKK